jgi:hypothetical protein
MVAVAGGEGLYPQITQRRGYMECPLPARICTSVQVMGVYQLVSYRITGLQDCRMDKVMVLGPATAGTSKILITE